MKPPCGHYVNSKGLHFVLPDEQYRDRPAYTRQADCDCEARFNVKTGEPVATRAEELATGGIREAQPRPTLGQMARAAKAVLTGEKVSLEVLQERIATCGTCRYMRVDPRTEKQWCRVCGCNLSPDDKRVLNLAAYEEVVTPAGKVKSGCKHPQRKQGRGWKR